jgi:hypothetical protein
MTNTLISSDLVSDVKMYWLKLKKNTTKSQTINSVRSDFLIVQYISSDFKFYTQKLNIEI